ncbi:MAG: GNAT family protein [Pseudomonadota bacterium]
MNLHIRGIDIDDAGNFLNLCRMLDEETTFMMLEPEERTTSVDKQRDLIQAALDTDNLTIIVAEVDKMLVGYVSAYGGIYKRNHHSAYVVAGIVSEYAGQGITTKLFGELDKWAIDQNIHRLELAVQVYNEKAYNLYKKAGFEVEGMKKDALFIKGAYVDEYIMAKLI